MVDNIVSIKELSGKRLLVHIILYCIGVFIMPLGVVFTINAHIGAGGYDALNFAIGHQLGIPTSYAIYMTALIALVIAGIIRKGMPNLLTFISSFFMGLATDFWKAMLENVQAEGILDGLLFTGIGLVIIAFAIAAYVISIFPTNPTDDLMVAISERNIRIGIAKVGMDIFFVVVAFLLGGSIGIGTIIVTFGLGAIVDYFQRILKKLLNQVL